jgi:histidinol phosphatase-like enzyme (inositol monophosphatase family)
MPPPADRTLLDEAVSLVQAAGALTLEWFQSASLDVEHKGDGTPVTQADRAAERFLREELATRHPDDGIIGEEEGAHEGSSGRTWIIDPIDGTKAFTRGVPLYTNLLAVHDEHGPAIGVLNVPALVETVAAGRGLGCEWNGKPCRVNDVDNIESSYLTTSGFGAWADEALLAVKHAGWGLRTWGDGYGYVLVATGRIEAMVDPEAAIWDLAPMPVILSEAGGRFTDWSGAETADGGNGVASNGKLHDELLGQLLG